MKKILTHLTGIVLLITILIAGACSPAEVPPPERDMSVVIIYVKDTIIDGENHLQLYDSNDTTKRVTDDLETEVTAGTEVYWVMANSSELKKVKRIRPKESNGNIINKNATGIWLFTKYKKHIVPDNAVPGVEKYYIKVKDKKGEKWEIDPYLKMR